MLGVLLTLGKGVRDGVLDTLTVGEGVILGGTVLLGVILGVTDMLGVLLGVTDMLGVLLGVTLGVKLIVGVMLGVTLIEGVILNDGVGVGVNGIHCLPTQVPKVSIITLPLTTSGLLPHTTIESLGSKARSCDATLSHRV